MTVLDILLRGGAIGLILLTAVLMLLRPAHWRQSLAVAAACLCLCCYLLVSNLEVRTALGPAVPVLLVALEYIVENGGRLRRPNGVQPARHWLRSCTAADKALR
ncbi:MAG: hypothetical protein AAF439_04555 [Pseudomonadota bacterium]